MENNLRSKHAFRVRVEDRPGVLVRVAGIIAAKGENITSLTVRAVPGQPGFSEIVFEAELEPRFVPRVENEMNRLIQVIDAAEIVADGVSSPLFSWNAVDR